MVSVNSLNILFSIVGFVYVFVMKLLNGEIHSLGTIWDAPMSLAQTNSILPLIMGNIPTLDFELTSDDGDLLDRNLDSLSAALEYFVKNAEKDPLIDVVAVIGGIKDNLKHVDINNIKDKSQRIKLEKAIALTENYLARGAKILELSQPEYYNYLKHVIDPNVWYSGIKTRPLPDVVLNQSEFATQDTIDGHFSDNCFNEILSCKVNDLCWNASTIFNQSGYTTTHQILYAIVAQTKCKNETTANLEKSNLTFEAINDALCGNVYDEAKHIVAQNYPEKNTDLYCEQLLVCGMLGYSKFFTKASLKAIMSWQSENGCYRHSFVGLIDYFMSPTKNRVRRNENLSKDLCMPHYTVVCAGALAMYVRYLVEDPNLTNGTYK